MKSKREIKFEWGIKFYKCTSCWLFLPYDRFGKNRLWYDCIMSECKKCSSKRVSEYRKKNKEKRNAYQREYWRRKEMMLTVTWLQSIQKSITQPEPVTAKISVNFEEKEITYTPSINKEPIFTNKAEALKPYTTSSKESEISSRLTAFTDKIKKETEELEKEQIDYEKEYPEAYQKIMSDENYSRAFNYKYTEEQRIDTLKREQAMIDKKKNQFEYKSDLDKMRAMYDTLLNDNEKKKFDEAIKELWWNWQDRFVHDVAKLPEHSFKNWWIWIYNNIKDIQKWKAWDKNFIL